MHKKKDRQLTKGRYDDPARNEWYFNRKLYAQFIKQLALAGVLHKCSISAEGLVMPNDPIIINMYRAFINK